MKKIIQSGALFTVTPFKFSKKQKQELHINNIVILGDSVAYGYGTKGGISKYLKETFPGSRVKNLGINGLTSNGMIEKLRTGIWDEAIQTADLVLLNIGGNDLLKGFRSLNAKKLKRLAQRYFEVKRTYRKNLLETYQKIRLLNDDALIVQNNLYNSMEKEQQYFGFTNLLLKNWNRAIGEKGVIVSKMDAMGKNPSIWLDAIHPNEKGYEMMHELLLKTLAGTGFVIQAAKSENN